MDNLRGVSDLLGFKRRKLLRTGAQGEAVVVETEREYHAGEHGGWTELHIRMKLRFPDGEIREYRRTQMLGDVSALSGGDKLPVRFDPDDREKLEVDLPEIKRRSAAEAATERQEGIARAEAELSGRTPPEATTAEDPAALLAQRLGAAGTEVHILQGSDPSAVTNAIGELAQLAKLHRDGSLSDAEFAAAKQRLLSG